MRRLACAIAGLALGLTLLSASHAGDDAKKALDALKGEWIAVSIEENGETKKPDAASAPTATFKGASVTVKVDGGEMDYEVVVDPSKKPATIDFKGEKGAVGIYKLEKDKLTICVTRKNSPDRPTEFSGSGDFTLVVLERKK